MAGEFRRFLKRHSRSDKIRPDKVGLSLIGCLHSMNDDDDCTLIGGDNIASSDVTG